MEEIIRTAREADAESLKALWDECFPEDKMFFRDFFFKNIFKPENTLVCSLGGEAVSMAHILPYDFKTPGGELFAKYVYGIATTKKCRGRGFAGKLLSRAESGCDFAALIPQSESLFGFYGRRGYSEVFFSQNGVAEKEDGRPALYSDIPYLNSVYEESLIGFIHPVRTEREWEIIIDEYDLRISQNGRGYFSDEEAMPPDDLFSRRIGLAKPISMRAKNIFEECDKRYMNLMHN